MKQFFHFDEMLSASSMQQLFGMFGSKSMAVFYSNLYSDFPCVVIKSGMTIPGFCIVICLSSCLLLILFLLLLQSRRQKRQILVARHRSTEYLRLLRALLDLCYTYGDSPQVFMDKFKDKVNIRELKSYEVIDYWNKDLVGLKEDEKILCLLWKQGFTHRELCVIFNLKRVSNLYIKYNRIQKKIKKP